MVQVASTNLSLLVKENRVYTFIKTYNDTNKTIN